MYHGGPAALLKLDTRKLTKIRLIKILQYERLIFYSAQISGRRRFFYKSHTHTHTHTHTHKLTRQKSPEHEVSSALLNLLDGEKKKKKKEKKFL